MILHSIETKSRSDIEEEQLEHLKKTVDHVFKNVPFYRGQFEKMDISSNDLNRIDDVRKLPFTTKKDLRDHYPFGLFAVAQEEIIRLHASSGTSGKSTVVGYTKEDIKSWTEIVARAIAIAGGKKGDILHNAYGYGLFTGGLGLHYGGEELGASVIPISGGNTDRQIEIIQDFKPRILCSTPSYALNIAERMMELGIDPASTPLELGIFGAEPWSEEMRKTLEKTFGIKACDIYGLSEVIGPGVSMECHEGQNGLHIAEDHFLVEVIDPATLEHVPDGADGELVFTSLKKEALPIIRYRTGDIASITREKCSCGRTTVRMSRVKGRIDDMIIVRGVNVFPSEVEHHLLQIPELVPHYQLHLHRTSSLDTVELHVEMTDSLHEHTSNDENHPLLQTLKAEIRERIKSFCLISVEVKIHRPKGIERSQGKAVRVVDYRKQKQLHS
ncbi:phenylacetate--CoA ligase family protein [Falsibacillus pallidus]|uniref:Phenylacetate-coenzyme A ligase n=1 Tax=Falsibacillus pallidus TaxID=493781 RepID=A0A370GWF8_9BACI|nr:phenylacetate--CoA ligase [Falsibacillus pallidus]RDI47982.1 phenylacetate-CoA ligase [Falsibacillus pallidus]